MLTATRKPSNQVMSVAYYAYGSALQRENRMDEALIAFEEAIRLDRDNGVAVINAASGHFALGIRDAGRFNGVFCTVVRQMHPPG